MKRICLVLLALLMMLSAIACETSDNDSSTVSEGTESSKVESCEENSLEISDDSEHSADEDSGAESSGESNDVSGDASDEESDDISDESVAFPVEKYPSKVYKSCSEFVENEKEHYERLLNLEPLSKFFDIDDVFSYPNEPRYGVTSVEFEEWYNNLTLVEIQDDPSKDVLSRARHYAGWIGPYPVTPTTRLDKFLKETCCYQYKKEDVDVFLTLWVGDEKDRLCVDIIVSCEIDGYIFTTDLFIDRHNTNITISEEGSYGTRYDRWRTEEEYAEIESVFEGAEWKYELLNIYNEDSEYIATLKEMVASQITE